MNNPIFDSPSGKSRYLVVTTEYLLPILTILLVALLWWLVFRTPFFTIQSITCQADYEPCANPSLLAELDKYRGQNLFALDTKSLSDKVQRGDYLVRAVEIKKTLPHTLELSIQSIYPAVAFQQKGVEGEWVVCDLSGRVIGLRKSDPNVPTIIAPNLGVVRPGQALVGESLASALELALLIHDEFLRVKKIELIDQTTILLVLTDGRQVLMTTLKDQLTQLRSLQAILADDTINTSIGFIDLRFAQPVLKSRMP